MRFSFLPIFFLLTLITVIYFTGDPALFFEPHWLLLIGNTVFITVIFLIVAYIAMKTYKATGRDPDALVREWIVGFCYRWNGSRRGKEYSHDRGELECDYL